MIAEADGTMMNLRESVAIDRRTLVGLFAYSLILWAGYIAYAVHLHMIGFDFSTFHRAAGESFDTVYAVRNSSGFAYPPTTLLWLKPFSLLGWIPGFILWTVLSIGLMGWASARLAGWRVALLVIASPALVTAIAVGQFGALVGALVLFAVSLKGWRQGVLLGLAATIKPQILLAAPLVLLARRDGPALLGAGLAAIAVTLAEVLLLGPDLWHKWFVAIVAFGHAVVHWGATAAAVSPAALAVPLGLPALPFLAFGALLLVVLLAKRARTANGAEQAALIVGGSALISPYLFVYDIAALMPFVVVCLARPGGRGWMAALATFLNPFAGFGLVWLVLALIVPKRVPEPSGTTPGLA
jgi:hypothetical protein